MSLSSVPPLSLVTSAPTAQQPVEWDPEDIAPEMRSVVDRIIALLVKHRIIKSEDASGKRVTLKTWIWRFQKEGVRPAEENIMKVYHELIYDCLEEGCPGYGLAFKFVKRLGYRVDWLLIEGVKASIRDEIEPDSHCHPDHQRRRVYNCLRRYDLLPPWTPTLHLPFGFGTKTIYDRPLAKVDPVPHHIFSEAAHKLAALGMGYEELQEHAYYRGFKIVWDYTVKNKIKTIEKSDAWEKEKQAFEKRKQEDAMKRQVSSSSSSSSSSSTEGKTQAA